jgi:hypothetical protein
MTNKTREAIANTSRITAAIVLPFVVIRWANQLLLSHAVGETSFVIFACVSLILAFAIAFIDRIQSFSLRDLSVQMGKVEAARQDVEAREQEVRRVAFTLAEIALFLAAFQHRILGEGQSEIQTAWLESKVHELLTTVSGTPDDQEHVFRLFAAAKDMDQTHGTIDAKEWDRRWDEIYKRIIDETKSTRLAR